jgi:Fe-S cluster biogenesis protein NfuA
MEDRKALERRAHQIEELVRRLESAPDPGLRTAARDLAQALMDMHGGGLVRLLELTDASGAPGAALLDQFAADPAVRQLLFLHGLHPVDLETRVKQALDKTRPYLQSHSGNVSIVAVEPDGTVRLRLEGSCHGCPSSQVTLKSAIEDVIYEAAPDVTELVVEGVTAPDPVPGNGFVALESLRKPKYDTCPTMAGAPPPVLAGDLESRPA